MKEPSVSIVLLNWNGWKDTVECLDSIKKLNYKNFDVWILDNGSEDKSVAKLKKFESRNVHLVLSKINHGFAEGNNFLVKEILKAESPDYILILNNDTILPKDLLSRLMETVEKNEASIVGPKLIYPDGNEIPSFCKMDKYLWDSKWEIFKGINKVIETDSVCGCCMLIKTEDYLKFNGFKKEYVFFNEEVDLCFKIVESGGKIFLDLRTRLVHKEGASFRKEKKVSLYYYTRNEFLLRIDHYDKIKYGLFLLRYFLIFFPKKIVYLIITKQINMIPVYLKGIVHGLLNLRGKRM